jgi:hypothetical protein
LLVLLAVPAFAPAQDPAEAARQERQVKDDTDRVVRRIRTMLRVMDYYQLDQAAEKQLLAEAAGTLQGLSKEQMAAVIERLDAAAAAPDEGKGREEVAAAYARHREIMAGLKRLLGVYEAVRSLDQAAQRLDKLAQDQVNLFLQSAQLQRDLIDSDLPEVSRRWYRRGGSLHPFQRAHRLADDQGDFANEVLTLFKQTSGLRDQLPADQQDRLQRAEQMVQSLRLREHLREPAHLLDDDGSFDRRLSACKRAAEAQWRTAGDLLELALTLRAPREPLVALREARERLTKALSQQETAMRDPEPEPAAAPERRGRFRDFEAATESFRRASDRADQQGLVEHATRDGRLTLRNHAPTVVALLRTAELAMKPSQHLIRGRESVTGSWCQRVAASELRAALGELDRLIEKAERERQDPLAAVQKALEAVEQLLKEQKDLRDVTQAADQSRRADRLAKLAPPQGDLARRTDEVRRQPLPPNKAAQDALKDAELAMREAARELADRQGKPALREQNEAVKALEEARRNLAEQSAAIAQRREDMNKLEDAAKKLAELEKQERSVAEQAKALAEAAKSADAQPLAKKQAELKPPTEAVGEQVKSAAPEAAKKTGEAAQSMESAKAALDKKKPKPASEKANDAADRLNEARQAVEKALDQKRGQEIADQAALQPKTVDPAQAAREVAKALEQTMKAADQAGKASDAPPNLAQMQKQVADSAEKIGQKEASKPADQAARSLRRGDFDAAAQQQKQALAQLQKAAGEKPEGSEGPTPGQLAKDQETLLRATEAMAKSQAATQAAQSALGQARAQAPPAVQPRLNEADQQLSEAGQQLGQGAPSQARQAQNQAAGQLAQALQALMAAPANQQANAGQQPGQGQGQQPGQGQGEQPGQGQGQKPGQGQGKGQNDRPTPGQERNQNQGQGRRVADGAGKNAESQGNDVKGDGSFIGLPPRQRELIRQAVGDKLPPEYAALIQQYYVNVAKGKPAAKPAGSEKP